MAYRGRPYRGQHRGRGRGGSRRGGRGGWRGRGNSAPVPPFPDSQQVSSPQPLLVSSPQPVLVPAKDQSRKHDTQSTPPSSPTSLVTKQAGNGGSGRDVPHVQGRSEGAGGATGADHQQGSGDGTTQSRAEKHPKENSLHRQMETFSLSAEDLLKVNKQIVMILQPRSLNKFFCTVCLSLLEPATICRHVDSAEHIRKVKLSLFADKNSERWCMCCCTMLTSDRVKAAHVEGKKHKKNLDVMQKYAQKLMDPIGEVLDEMMTVEVLKEGTGLTLGITPTMMKFLQDNKPYIGLRHAQEIGTGDDPNPKVFCTLCKVQSEPSNYQLHFTSSAHRMNVLKNDYPEKLPLLKDFSEGTRGVFNSKLKEIAADIEKQEGRKVELIQRKILKGKSYYKHSTRPYTGQSTGMDQKSPRGAFRGGRGSPRGGRGTVRGNRGAQRGGGHGSDRGRPRGRGICGGRGVANKNYTPYGLKDDQWSGSLYDTSKPGYGPQSQQGSGRSSYERGGYSPAVATGQDDSYWSQDDTEYGEGRDYSQELGKGKQRGQGRYHPYARTMSSGSIGRYGERGGAQKGRAGGWGHGSNQFQDQIVCFTDEYALQDYSTDYQGASSGPPAMGNPGGMPPPMVPPSGPPPNPAAVMHQMTLEKLKNETGDKTEAFKALASSMITSEEAADDAFQLSSALTQALLDYRMKALGSMVPESPISSLLGIIQKPQKQ